MLTNADFRRLLSTGAQHSGATDERATAKPPAAPEPRIRHSGGRRPEVPFDILRLAAEAVACACVERVPLRTSTGLSRVPAESRNVVFACAAETLKSLPRLRVALQQCPALWPDAIIDDLSARDTDGSRTSAAASGSASHEKGPRVRLSLACVCLHDMAGGRWLDATAAEVGRLIAHRRQLTDAYEAASAETGAGAADEAGEYLLFGRVNTLRCDVETAISRLRADGWSEVAPLAVSDGGGRRLGSELLSEAPPEAPAEDQPPREGSGGWYRRNIASRAQRRRAFSRDALLPDVLVFPPGAAALRSHPLVEEGSLVLQDRASCAVGHVLRPERGAVLVDACAAPGKKTAHLAGLICNDGEVYAFERDETRAAELNRAMGAAGASCVRARAADFGQVAADGGPEGGGWARASGLLLDPSCSGSGTSFFNVGGGGGGGGGRAGGVDRFASSQLSLLLHAMGWGPSLQTIVYSTCSVHAAENEGVVAAALGSRAGAGWVLDTALPAWPRRGVCGAGLDDEDAAKVVRFDSELDLCLGFFIARFVRRAAAAVDAAVDAAATASSGEGAAARRFASCVYDNLSALVRSACSAPPAAPSDSEAEAEAGWPDGCEGCGGVDDVVCDEFVSFVEDGCGGDAFGGSAALELCSALTAAAGDRLVRLGIAHGEARVTATVLRVLAALLRAEPLTALPALLAAAPPAPEVRPRRSSSSSARRRAGLLRPSAGSAAPCVLELALARGCADSDAAPAVREAVLLAARAALLAASAAPTTGDGGGASARAVGPILRRACPPAQLVAALVERSSAVADAARELACDVLGLDAHTLPAEAACDDAGAAGRALPDWSSSLQDWISASLDVAQLQAGPTEQQPLGTVETEGRGVDEAFRAAEAAVALVARLLERASAPRRDQTTSTPAAAAADATAGLLRDRGMLPRCLALLPLAVRAHGAPGLRERLLGLVTLSCEAGASSGPSAERAMLESLSSEAEALVESGDAAGALRLLGACRPSICRAAGAEGCASDPPPPVALLLRIARACEAGLFPDPLRDVQLRDPISRAVDGRRWAALSWALSAAQRWDGTAWARELRRSDWCGVLLRLLEQGGRDGAAGSRDASVECRVLRLAAASLSSLLVGAEPEGSAGRGGAPPPPTGSVREAAASVAGLLLRCAPTARIGSGCAGEMLRCDLLKHLATLFAAHLAASPLTETTGEIRVPAALLDGATDASGEVRRAAADAMRQLVEAGGSRGVLERGLVASLVEMVRGEHAAARAAAISTASQLCTGSDGWAAVRAHDADWEATLVRIGFDGAAEAGSEAEAVAAALAATASALRRDHSRATAIEALSRACGGEPSPAEVSPPEIAASVEALVTSPHPEVAASALGVLEAIALGGGRAAAAADSAGEAAARTLLDQLGAAAAASLASRHANPRVRQHAARLLRAMRPPAGEEADRSHGNGCSWREEEAEVEAGPVEGMPRFFGGQRPRRHECE